MRSWAIGLSILVGSVVAIPAPAPLAAQDLVFADFPASAVIRGENVWLRDEPALDPRILAYLQRGDAITVTGEAIEAEGETFYPVEALDSGETGWIRDLFIDPGSIGEAVVVEVSEPEPEVEAVAADESGQERRRNRNRNLEGAGTSEPDQVPQQDNSGNNQSGNSVENPAPMGTLLRAEGLAVTIGDAQFRDSVDFSEPRGGYKYLEVSVRIKNNGTEDHTYAASDFSAEDASSGAGFDSVTVLSPDELNFDTLSPEEYVTGLVYFEVQETTEQAIVKFDPNQFTEEDLYWIGP